MAKRHDNLDRLRNCVAAIARRQDRLFETLQDVVGLVQLLLADANAGGMAWEEKSVSPPRAPGDTATRLASKNGSGKKGSPAAEPAAEASADRVYVTWLLDGVLGGKWLPRQDAKAFLAEHKFDFILDETADRLIVNTLREQSNMPLYPIPPHIKVFVWLVLTHVGRALEYREIAERLGYGGIETAPRDNRIHRLRNRFNKQLGSLSNRIFGAGKNRAYPVRRQGWSFCWLREAQQAEQSVLLWDVQDGLS
jgi:hypothetical protein